MTEALVLAIIGAVVCAVPHLWWPPAIRRHRAAAIRKDAEAQLRRVLHHLHGHSWVELEDIEPENMEGVLLGVSEGSLFAATCTGNFCEGQVRWRLGMKEGLDGWFNMPATPVNWGQVAGRLLRKNPNIRLYPQWLPVPGSSST